MARSLFAAKLLQGIRTKASRSEGGKENKEILTAAEQAWGAHSQTQPASSHLRFPGNTSVLLRHGWVPLSLTMKMHPVETTKGIPGSELSVHTSAPWAGRRQRGLESLRPAARKWLKALLRHEVVKVTGQAASLEPCGS